MSADWRERIDPDVTRSFVATIEEGVRLHAKAVLLDERARACIAVATATAARGGVDPAEIRRAARSLKPTTIKGRGPIGVMAREAQQVQGDIWVRVRGSNARLPKAPAFVYLLRDDTGKVIYIGYSENIGTRLGDHKGKPWVTADLIGCDNVRAARALEGDLIFQHKPPLNKADTRRRRFVVVD